MKFTSTGLLISLIVVAICAFFSVKTSSQSEIPLLRDPNDGWYIAAYQVGYKPNFDSVYALCKERGHVWKRQPTISDSDYIMPPYVRDEKDTSWMIIPVSPMVFYNCIRCRKDSNWKEEGKEILWIRKHN